MKSGPVVFVDLDDTLFQTAGKCPDGMSSGLLPMSRLEDGSVSGFATPVQQKLLAWLRDGSVIPVTARSSVVLARVDVEQAPAICSNGGRINVLGGGLDMEWHARLRASAGSLASVSDMHRVLTADLDPRRFRHWVVSEAGLDLYVVVKSNVDDGVVLDEVASVFGDLHAVGWRMHRNGNNLAFLPTWLSKRDAVAYLLEALRRDVPGRPVVGVGDSLSDAGFMDLCDFAMTPTASQLWRAAVRNNEWVPS